MSAIEITWAGGEDSFRLGLGELRALQQRCDAGPQWILARLNSGQWLVDDIINTIRLGLEGGGMSKEDARKKVTNHVEEQPIALSVLAARLILMAALYGSEDDPVGEARGEAAPKQAPSSPEENGSSPDSTPTAPSSDSTPAP